MEQHVFGGRGLALDVHVQVCVHGLVALGPWSASKAVPHSSSKHAQWVMLSGMCQTDHCPTEDW